MSVCVCVCVSKLDSSNGEGKELFPFVIAGCCETAEGTGDVKIH